MFFVSTNYFPTHFTQRQFYKMNPSIICHKFIQKTKVKFNKSNTNLKHVYKKKRNSLCCKKKKNTK